MRTSSLGRRFMTSSPSFTCATMLPCVMRTTLGRLTVPDEFFEPLPEDLVAAFEGRGE